MRILVEASSIYDQHAGIGRYARHIVGEMLSSDEETDFRLLRTSDDADVDLSYFESALGHRTVRKLPLSRRNAYRIWFRLGIPFDIQLISGRADVAYSPDFTIWHTRNIPRVVTVHDLAHMTHPQFTTPGLLGFLNRVVIPQVEQAAKIAVVSKATGTDLQRLLGVRSEDIIYAPNGVDDRFLRAEPLSEHERKVLGLPQDFGLMVGTIEPRKNHENAIRAWELSELGGKVPLVILGREGWGLDRIYPILQPAIDRGTVIYRSYLEDTYLPSVMRSARMLIFPSWTEGFGLPVAEMLATGGNVVTSSAPALLEVADGHSWHAAADDPEGLADAIGLASIPPTPQQREARRNSIRERYSWVESAGKLLEEFKRLTD